MGILFYFYFFVEVLDMDLLTDMLDQLFLFFGVDENGI